MSHDARGMRNPTHTEMHVEGTQSALLPACPPVVILLGYVCNARQSAIPESWCGTTAHTELLWVGSPTTPSKGIPIRRGAWV